MLEVPYDLYRQGLRQGLRFLAVIVLILIMIVISVLFAPFEPPSLENLLYYALFSAGVLTIIIAINPELKKYFDRLKDILESYKNAKFIEKVISLHMEERE
jgi:DNA integrity scanning protein DisA with diadenylate cyclase activity